MSVLPGGDEVDAQAGQFGRGGDRLLEAGGVPLFVRLPRTHSILEFVAMVASRTSLFFLMYASFHSGPRAGSWTWYGGRYWGTGT